MEARLITRLDEEKFSTVVQFETSVAPLRNALGGQAFVF